MGHTGTNGTVEDDGVLRNLLTAFDVLLYALGMGVNVWIWFRMTKNDWNQPLEGNEYAFYYGLGDPGASKF